MTVDDYIYIYIYLLYRPLYHTRLVASSTRNPANAPRHILPVLRLRSGDPAHQLDCSHLRHRFAPPPLPVDFHPPSPSWRDNDVVQRRISHRGYPRPHRWQVRTGLLPQQPVYALSSLHTATLPTARLVHRPLHRPHCTLHTGILVVTTLFSNHPTPHTATSHIGHLVRLPLPLRIFASFISRHCHCLFWAVYSGLHHLIAH